MTRFNFVNLFAKSLNAHKDWPEQWPDAAPKPAYDAIIVGGGGHGLAAAYYLAKKYGIRNVAVLEKGWIGGGNTGRNTTIIRSNYLYDESAFLYDHAVKLWDGLSQELNYNTMYSKRGVMMLAHNVHDVQSFKRHIHANRLNGVDNEWLSAEEAKAYCPPLSIDPGARHPVLGAALQRRGGTARHDAVAWGYARAADGLGVDIIQNCEVTGFQRRGDAVVGVETSRGRIGAGKVGICVAGNSGHVAGLAGLRLPIESQTLQALVTEGVKPMINGVIMSQSLHCYISQSDKGGIVMGGDPDNWPSYAQRGQPMVTAGAIAQAIALVPALSRLRMLRTWGGVTDMSFDGSPIIGTTPVPGLYLNGGWCYGGFKATPASGWTYAHTLATGYPHALNAPFDLARFRRGDTIDENGTGAMPNSR